MELKKYLVIHRGAARRLAAMLGVSPSYLSQMTGGARPWRPSFCVQIEEATGGAVTRADLRPDDWQEIWPEYSPPQKELAAHVAP